MRKRIPSDITRKDFESTQYGELKVAERDPLVHIESHNGVSAKRSTTTTTNAGSAGRDGAEIQLTTSTNSDDAASLQSNTAIEYTASKEAQVSTFLRRPAASAPESDQFARWGGFHGDDGLFYEEDAGGLKYGVRRGSTIRYLTGSSIDADAVRTDIDVAASSLDLTQGRVWGIDYSWYGAGGRVEWYVETPRNANRKPYDKSHRRVLARYVPELDTQTKGPFIDTPNVPVRVEVDNGGSSPSSGLDYRVGGRQLGVIGNRNPNRRIHEQRFAFTADSGDDGAQPGTSFSPLVAIRPQSTFPSGVRENGINVRIESVEFSAGSAADVRATVGTSFSSSSFNDPADTTSDESAVEIATEPSIDARGENAPPRRRVPGSGKGNASEGGSEAGITLGVEQSYLIEGKTDSASTDFYLSVRWSESF